MAASKRALARRLLRRASKNASEKVMSVIGGRLVSGMADTSSDAPSGGFEPKRNRYAEMQEEQRAAREQARAKAMANDADAHAHSHSHGHDHGHDHDHEH